MTEIEHLEAIQEGMAGYIRFLIGDRMRKEQHLVRMVRLLEEAKDYPPPSDTISPERWEEWFGRIDVAFKLMDAK